MVIKSVTARQILDSRGNPTVEADVILEDGTIGRAAVPSGASTGSHEVIELRDTNEAAYNGKGVMAAVKNVKDVLSGALVGIEVVEQGEIDKQLIALDGTPNKGKLGGNAILAVSLAAAKAAALSKGQPLYAYVGDLAGNQTFRLPMPLMNILNGGKHAAGSTDIQEFMVVPVGARNFAHAVQMGAEVFHALAKVLTAKGYGTTVGDEGGYAPAVKKGNQEALELISEAIQNAGYKLGEDFVLALDVASSELFHNSVYRLATEQRALSSEEMIEFYTELQSKFPIRSIEDGLSEDDWDGWTALTTKLGGTTQLVGDDLLVTNVEFLRKGIDHKAGNAILVKPNQIGTLSETIDAVKMAKGSGWHTILSHRSGETEDTTIAHLAVGLDAGQIKTGSLSRTDRLAKYNELIRIEEMLGKDAQLAKDQF